ncbi:hypothetical protein T484DRAFT_1756760 [Baffinella frigidus]|nr:hypothetical protein T484DRAFT_1756760 [Cryptophyta sp. CCMP2293]
MRKEWTCESWEGEDISPFLFQHHKKFEKEVQACLLKEASGHNDLIFLPTKDFYRNLPRKLKDAYQWSLEFTNATWFLKADDDVVFVEVKRLEKFLCSLERQERTVVGRVVQNVPVHREGKWAETNFLPSLYPPFCIGSFGHAVSSDIAAGVVEIDGFEYQGEDVSLGIWLDESPRRNDISWISAPGFYRDDDGERPEAVALFLGTAEERGIDELYLCPAAHKHAGYSGTERLRYMYGMEKWRSDNKGSITASRKLHQWRSQDSPPPLDHRSKVLAFNLISCERFDLVPKVMYARSLLSGSRSLLWTQLCYTESIRALNGFSELCYASQARFHAFQGPCAEKHGALDFLHAFESIVSSLILNGFDGDHPSVPVDHQGVIQNGAHRVAAMYAISNASLIPIEILPESQSGDMYGLLYFREKGLADVFVDAFALRYIEWIHSTSFYAVCLFPVSRGQHMDEILSMVSSHGKVFTSKEVFLEKNGPDMFIQQLYFWEEWIEHGSMSKTSLCFPSSSSSFPLHVIFLQSSAPLSTVVKMKESIRDLFGVGKHSVHVTDNHEETIEVARLVLVQNSVDHLNWADRSTPLRRLGNRAVASEGIDDDRRLYYFDRGKFLKFDVGKQSFFACEPHFVASDSKCWLGAHAALTSSRFDLLVGVVHAFFYFRPGNVPWRVKACSDAIRRVVMGTVAESLPHHFAANFNPYPSGEASPQEASFNLLKERASKFLQIWSSLKTLDVQIRGIDFLGASVALGTNVTTEVLGDVSDGEYQFDFRVLLEAGISRSMIEDVLWRWMTIQTKIASPQARMVLTVSNDTILLNRLRTVVQTECAVDDAILYDGSCSLDGDDVAKLSSQLHSDFRFPRVRELTHVRALFFLARQELWGCEQAIINVCAEVSLDGCAHLLQNEAEVLQVAAIVLNANASQGGGTNFEEIVPSLKNTPSPLESCESGKVEGFVEWPEPTPMIRAAVLWPAAMRRSDLFDDARHLVRSLCVTPSTALFELEVYVTWRKLRSIVVSQLGEDEWTDNKVHSLWPESTALSDLVSIHVFVFSGSPTIDECSKELRDMYDLADPASALHTTDTSEGVDRLKASIDHPEPQWWSAREMFQHLDLMDVPYALLRNFENGPIPPDAHPDIDLLIGTLNPACRIMDRSSIPCFHNTQNQGLYGVSLGGLKVKLDIRVVGDNYYDPNWAREMLERRVRSGFIWTLSPEDHFYGLLYHVLVQKNKIARDYPPKMCSMAKSLGIDISRCNHRSDLLKLLVTWMRRHNYQFVRPSDLNVPFHPPGSTLPSDESILTKTADNFLEASRRTAISGEQFLRDVACCGEICNHSMTGTPSHFFQHIRKNVNCAALWENCTIVSETRGINDSLDMPADLEKFYSYDGKVQISNVQMFNESTIEETEMVWTWEKIEKWRQMCEARVLPGSYGLKSTNAVMEGLMRTPGLRGGHVLVLGSKRPWLEACCLAAGASKITTLEYRAVQSHHPKVKVITPAVARELVLNGELVFDAVATFSSVEHSGLGRYGDRFNPWGDLMAVAMAWCICRPRAGMMIGVPSDEFLDIIEWNQHRIYGPVMLPHLLSNWEQILMFEGGVHRVFVVKKVHQEEEVPMVDSHTPSLRMGSFVSQDRSLKLVRGERCDGTILRLNDHLSAFNQALRLSQRDPPRRYLIYRSASFYCGGFGSRLWGIANTFLWSLLSNRTFVIEYDHPHPLGIVFTQNLVRWDQDLPAGPRHRLTLVDSTLEEAVLLNGDWNTMFEKERIVEVVGANMPSEPLLRQNPRVDLGRIGIPPPCSLTCASQHRKGTSETKRRFDQQFHLWKAMVWHALFLPSRDLTALASPVAQHMSTFDLVVGIHVRNGGHFGSTTDAFRHSGESHGGVPVSVDWFPECASNLTRAARKLSGQTSVAWFVASDQVNSADWIRGLGEAEGVKVLSLNKTRTVHTDQSPDQTEREWLETVADWFLLGKTTLLIQSPSSFSLTAAMWAGKRPIMMGEPCILPDL